MASPEKSEPKSEPESMEDILASIRKIIAEDPPKKAYAGTADASSSAVLDADQPAGLSAKALSLGTPLPRPGANDDKKVLFQPPSARDALFRRPAAPEVAEPEAKKPAEKEPETRLPEAPELQPNELQPAELLAVELPAPELETKLETIEPAAVALPSLEAETAALEAADSPPASAPAETPPLASSSVERALADLLEDFDVTAAIGNGIGTSSGHAPPPPFVTEPQPDATEDASLAAPAESVAEAASEPQSNSDVEAPPAEAPDAILNPSVEPDEPPSVEEPPVVAVDAEFGGRLLEEPAPETTHTLPSAFARAIAGDDDFLEMPSWAAALRFDEPHDLEPQDLKPSAKQTPPPLKDAAPSDGGGSDSLAAAIARVASAITPTEELYGTLKAGDLSDGMASALSRLAGEADTAAASTTALKELAAGLAAASNREMAAVAAQAALPPSSAKPEFLKPPPMKPEFAKPDSVPPPIAAFAAPPTPVSAVAPEAVFEDTVSKLLKPMLQQWLSDNMPRIIENALRAEVGETLGKPSKPRV